MVILDKKTLSPIVWGENIGRAIHSIEDAENPTILDLAGNVDMVLSVIDKLKANGYIPPQKGTGKERNVFGLTVKEIDLLQRLQSAKERLATFLEGDYAWNINFNRFNEFVKVNGRYPINGAKDDKEERFLGSWVSNQRQAYKNGKLSKNRIEQLNSINFVWDVREQKWQEHLIALKEFLDKKTIFIKISLNVINIG